MSTNVDVTALSKTELKVAWVTPQGVNDLYNLSAEATASTTHSCSPGLVWPGQSSCTIKDLSPFTSYSVRVEACKEGQCGYSQTVTALTQPEGRFLHFSVERCIRHFCTVDFLALPTFKTIRQMEG